MEKLNQKGCEEVEIQFIDGEAHLVRLADTLERYEEISLFNGPAKDCAYDLIEETTEIPKNLRYYIDYDPIACDMEINGEITEISHNLIVINANEF